MMFVFDDLAALTDREIQVVLREVEQKDLVVALKAASEEVVEKILGNMSDRVRDFVAEEMEFLGPMRLSEVEDIQLRIVQKVRQLEEQGIRGQQLRTQENDAIFALQAAETRLNDQNSRLDQIEQLLSEPPRRY